MNYYSCENKDCRVHVFLAGVVGNSCPNCGKTGMVWMKNDGTT